MARRPRERSFLIIIFWQIMYRHDDQGEWKILGREEIEVISEKNRLGDTSCFFLRANISKVSHWAVVQRALMGNPYARCTPLFPWSTPSKRQVAFANATEVPFTFLVLPTTWNHFHIRSVSVALHTGVGPGVEGTMERDMKQTIFPEATQVQVLYAYVLFWEFSVEVSQTGVLPLD